MVTSKWVMIFSTQEVDREFANGYIITEKRMCGIGVQFEIWYDCGIVIKRWFLFVSLYLRTYMSYDTSDVVCMASIHQIILRDLTNGY